MAVMGWLAATSGPAPLAGSRDLVFYGVAFGECPPSPPDSYRLFYGCVVDFLHLDVYSGQIFGRNVALFPIGNIADVAIIAGVVLILLTQGRFHEAVQAREIGEPVEPAPATPEA